MGVLAHTTLHAIYLQLATASQEQIFRPSCYDDLNFFHVESDNASLVKLNCSAIRREKEQSKRRKYKEKIVLEHCPESYGTCSDIEKSSMRFVRNVQQTKRTTRRAKKKKARNAKAPSITSKKQKKVTQAPTEYQSSLPSHMPSFYLTNNPSEEVLNQPSLVPSNLPSSVPTSQPSNDISISPSVRLHQGQQSN